MQKRVIIDCKLEKNNPQSGQKRQRNYGQNKKLCKLEDAGKYFLRIKGKITAFINQTGQIVYLNYIRFQSQ